MKNSISDAEKIAIIDNSRLSNLNTDSRKLETIIRYLDVLKVLSNRNKTGAEKERIKKDKDIISKFSNSYTVFFETKNILQEELLNKMYSNIDTLISSGVLNLRSLSEKQEFYKKNGFIIETQQDVEGNKVLVIYDGKFEQPFSVHFINLSPETTAKIDSAFIGSEKTLAHTKIGLSGLTKANTNRSDFRKNALITSPGFYENKPVQAAKLYNYLQYDASIIKDSNNQILDKIEEDMNKGIVNDNTIQQLISLDSKYFLKDFKLTKNQRMVLNADSYFFDVDKRIKLIRRYYDIMEAKENPDKNLGDRG